MRRLFLKIFLFASLMTAAAGTAADKQSDLIEKAKKEGSLTNYTTANTGDQETLYRAFNQKYPFIKIDGVRLQLETWTDKVAAERAARRYTADVGWGHIFAITAHVKEGFLAQYNSPERSAVSDGYRDKEGFWTAYSVSFLTAAYNTDLVKAGDAPKTWDDLASPKWKGRTVADDYNIELLHAMIDAWGKEKAVAYWRRVAANNAVLVQGRSNQIKLVQAGEYAIGIGLHAHDAIKAAHAGAPLRWLNSLSPTPVLLQGVGVYKDAPHPNAARLFVDWLLSMEGQQILAKTGRIPARQGIPTEAVLASGVKISPVGPALAAKERELAILYQDIMGITRVGQ